MRYLNDCFLNEGLVKTIVLFILFSTITDGQSTAKFVGLGHLPGGISSQARDVSADGLVVIGNYSTGAVQAGFLWTETSGFQPLPNFYIPRGVSGDGSVIVGSLNGNTLAGKWVNGSTTQLPAIWTGVNTSSSAMAVSTDGAVIAGYSSSNEFGVQQCTRWAGGQPSGLGLGPGGDASYAYNISPDGTAIVGRFRLAEPSPDQISHAFLSMNGGIIQSLGAGTYLESQAWGVSNGGNVVVGALTATYLGPTTAARWTPTGGWEPLNGTVGSSIAFDVSADGSIIVGSMAGKAFIWDADSSARDLKTILENDYHLDLTGWILTQATAIDSSGTVIVGYGSHNGKTEAWYAKLPRLKITKPTKNMKWIAGEKDTIKWRGGEKNQIVAIEYSVDSGRTFTLFDFVASGDTGLYVWNIPADILSKKCMIRIYDFNDTTIVDTSDVFVIKPYILTRDSSGQYEPYKPEEDQWGFWNIPNHIFPQPWYQQFFYQGIDPFTSSQYSQWQGGFTFAFAKSSDFPDWISWVNAFGINACYVSTTLKIYSPTAIQRWSAGKKSWNGSCFGIAASNALAFSYKGQFHSKYSSFPAFANPISVLSNDGVKKAVNELFTHQFGNPSKQSQIGRWNVVTPNQTISELKEMFKADNVSPRTLTIWNNNGPGGHNILPYKLEQEIVMKHKYNLYVYDNSYPTVVPAIIKIDTLGNSNNGTWTPMYAWANWGGSKKLMLENESSVYFNNATFKRTEAYTSPFVLSSDKFEVYTNIDANTQIKDALGNVTGYSNGSVLSDIPNSVPLFYLDGSETPPYGYSLPTNNYSVIVDNFLSDTVKTFFFTGNKTFSYRRNNAEQTQTDRFFFDGGLSVANPDQQSKTISLLNIINETTQEKLFAFSSMELAENDSVKIENPDSNKIKLTSYGTAKDYDIELNYVTESGIGRFGNSHISLSSNTSHTLLPNWNNVTNEVLKVLVDVDNNGTIDDTLSLLNQLTGLGDDQGSVIPTEFRLEQNYPNPFNPVTKIRYSIPQNVKSKTSEVILKVYDVLGNEVATLVNEEKPAGGHEVEFDASNLTSGVYFYKLQAGDFVETKKMLLLK